MAALSVNVLITFNFEAKRQHRRSALVAELDLVVAIVISIGRSDRKDDEVIEDLVFDSVVFGDVAISAFDLAVKGSSTADGDLELELLSLFYYLGADVLLKPRWRCESITKDENLIINLNIGGAGKKKQKKINLNLSGNI